MVVIHEAQNMFWGVTLDGGKRYTQTVERSFHISMAALEVVTNKDDKSLEGMVSVMIQHDKAEFLVCTLEYGKLYQQPLDLNFTEGEEVTFFLNGKGKMQHCIVHLTGYLVQDEGEDDFGDTSGLEDISEADMSSEEEADDDDDEDDSEDDIPKLKALDTDSDDHEEEDEDDEEELSPGKKRKKQDKKPQKKQKLMEVEFDEEDEEDDDFSPDEDDDEEDEEEEDEDAVNSEAIEELLELEAASDDESDEDDDVEEADMSGSFLQTDKKSKDKKAKKQEQTPGSGKKDKKNKKDTPSGKPSPQTEEKLAANGTSEGGKKKKNKNKKKKKGGETPGKTEEKQGNGTPQAASGKPISTPGSQGKPASTPGSQSKQQGVVKKVLAGGIICEDQKVGGGPEAKSGKTCHMIYTGRLQQNGKQFDSNVGGKPFRFKLGKNEVIKGWDVGVQGMKVGGKRKLTVPAAYGYGSQRMGSIPANSSLVFDIELKAVS